MLFIIFLRFHNRLSGSETRDRNAVGRAGNIIQSNSVEEFDGRRFASVLPANAEFQVGFCGTAFLNGHFHKHADTFLIKSSERIGFEDAFFIIIAQKFAGVVAAETERHLRQVIGSETEEIGFFCDFVRTHALGISIIVPTV